MIDFHTHILPNIDDGPVDWKEALSLLRQGMEDGIRGAVSTSHVLNRLDEILENRMLETFQELQLRARQEGIEMTLWLGSEIHCQSVFSYTSKVATINGQRKYLLFELPLGDIPLDANERIFDMGINGIVPVLAHPERNMQIMRNPETVFELVNRGVLMQLNGGSITGVFGTKVRKVAEILLNHRLIHFVGSDCHGGGSRPMLLSRAYREIHKNWGEETARNLFYRHAHLAVQGKPVSVPPPISFDRPRKKRWFGF
ncbi:hypothetical protein JW948_19415 [bacterium]|nr:hypothetical protein [bacterium]